MPTIIINHKQICYRDNTITVYNKITGKYLLRISFFKSTERRSSKGITSPCRFPGGTTETTNNINGGNHISTMNFKKDILGSYIKMLLLCNPYILSYQQNIILSRYY